MPGFPVLHCLLEFMLKLMSTESVMPSNHLILCHPLLPLPSIFPSLGVFSNVLALHIRWPKYWSITNSQCCDSFACTAKGPSPTYICPLSPKLPSHPGCHITLSRSPYAIQEDLVGYPFEIQQCVQVHPKLPNYPFPSSFPH